ncbi:MAG: hypothetical protein M0028_04425, partial [Clostridia bacterium]|nr:hypothetical protein [Clostridia bacterium]
VCRQVPHRAPDDRRTAGVCCQVPHRAPDDRREPVAVQEWDSVRCEPVAAVCFASGARFPEHRAWLAGA